MGVTASTSTAPARPASTAAAPVTGAKAAHHGAAEHSVRVTHTPAGHVKVSPNGKTTPITTHVVESPPVAHNSLATEIQNFAVSWEPVVAILFFVALVVLMWRTL